MRKVFDPKQFQHVLGLAGMLSILGGIVFLIYPALFYRFFINDDLISGPFVSTGIANIVTVQLWSVLLVIGFGLIWASVKPVENRLFVFIAGLMKILSGGIWILAYSNGAMKQLALVIAILDLLFGTAFLLFYYFTRKEN